ncbi:MAG: hypothetical protein GY910_06425 [bacterium]|nr:hypothetical protein [bacterium]
MSASSDLAHSEEFEQIKGSVVDVVHDMDRAGLTGGMAGNVSVHCVTEAVVLTPTAM